MLGRSPAARADDARRVRIVHHDERIVLSGEPDDPVQPGHVSVHAEDAVGCDEPDSPVARFLQPGLQVVHVSVGVAEPRRLAEPDAVDDGSVVQGVADDGVLRPENRLEEARVGVEAGGVEDGVVGLEEIRNRFLEILVQVLRPADEPHRGHAEAVVLERPRGGLDDRRVVGEPEIVVGAEV